MMKKLLASVKEMNLEIDCIAPDHGLIWRKNPGAILEAYERWAYQKARAKALVVYDTMWHSTEFMAKAVYDGLMDKGLCVQQLNLGMNHRSDVITEMLDAKGMVFGSPTLNNGMLPRMADMLTYMRGLKPFDKYVAAFGSYGWSGEAVKHINQYLEEMKLEIVHPGIKAYYKPDHEVLKECRELGQLMGQKILDSDIEPCEVHP